MMFVRRKPHGPKMIQGRGCGVIPFAPMPMGGPAPGPGKPRRNHRPMPAQGRGCFMM
ncbi:hypothetical protein [Butyrivibrio sp. AD3002]|uniref:hypothetical protein n=1 Tax=Butyrivibrio sp. AD3002 TaxID=1280670 RepID=UPI0003B3944F|nr:hypothetical protein [Butyrivibrio sp. AD3002]